MAGPRGRYTEPGGTWWPFWIAVAAVSAVLVADVVLPGPGIPPPAGVLALVLVPGVVAAGCLSARRMWTVRVDEGSLSVGRETVRLSEIDVGHLRAVDSGVDAGAPVLGGGWALPRGRAGLPLRFTDGRTALVPTRDPAALHEALVARLTDTEADTPDGAPGTQGTLGS